MMDYTHTDYNGTDDDYQPLYNNRVASNRRVSGNGRFNLGSLPPPRVHIDMEAEIHQLEQEAYSAVLRAFKAQSDALTWEKEGLITELRKELRVSDDEHRELLTRVNADDIIRSIREWRQAGGLHGAGVGTPQPLHDLSSPTASARKRQKIAQSGPVTYGGTPRGLHSQSVAASMQPSFSAGRRGPAPGGIGRRPNTVHPMPGLSSTRAGIYSSATHTPRGQFTSRGSSGAVVTNETAVDDPLIGRKVMTRWPEDNNFYEAVITDYNPVEGRHALVYDIHTAKETWEWVDLKEILPKDIRWVGEDPGINSGGDGGFDPSANHHVVVTPAAAGGGAGSGRVSGKDQFKKQVSSQLQNGAGNVSEEIEILHTETLIREVEKIFDASHPDLHEIEKAKKMLKDHEQALMNVIEKLADASDSESDGEQQQNLHGQAANNGGRISMPNQP